MPRAAFRVVVEHITLRSIDAYTTLQTVAMIGYLTEYKDAPGPHMVLAPKSTMSNWLKEFKKWLPGVNASVKEDGMRMNKMTCSIMCCVKVTYCRFPP